MHLSLYPRAAHTRAHTCAVAEGELADERGWGGEAAVGDTLARTLSTFLALHWDDDDNSSNHDADHTADAEPPPPRAWLREAQTAAAVVVAAAVRATPSTLTLRFSLLGVRISKLSDGERAGTAGESLSRASNMSHSSARTVMHVLDYCRVPQHRTTALPKAQPVRWYGGKVG